jgi:hypothetical protein
MASLLKRVDTGPVPMIQVGAQAFPVEMLSTDLRKRWQAAQARAGSASTAAARTKACDQILKLTAEAAIELAPHGLLRLAPRRSLFDLGKN